MSEAGADKPTGGLSAKVFLGLVGAVVLLVVVLAAAFVGQQINFLFWLGVVLLAVAVVACLRLFRRAREQLREMMAAGKAFALSLITMLVLAAIIYAIIKYF